MRHRTVEATFTAKRVYTKDAVFDRETGQEEALEIATDLETKTAEDHKEDSKLTAV